MTNRLATIIPKKEKTRAITFIPVTLTPLIVGTGWRKRTGIRAPSTNCRDQERSSNLSPDFTIQASNIFGRRKRHTNPMNRHSKRRVPRKHLAGRSQKNHAW
ncbi:hypothetical protein M9H77_17975 [Catharanthus roseus]|uniref:Uncharacterized protein n=1 Tax=Catharanthus roseus TaxID=4058 RepID=A0ACC0B6C9_CATRO|nr:hypothetical protein M9H77_17975 [Catharanthus roseus]